MKERINLSLEYEVVEQARKSIKNLSAFVEVCLKNYNKNLEKKILSERQTKESLKRQFPGASNEYINDLYIKTKHEEKKWDDLVRIAETKWTED